VQIALLTWIQSPLKCEPNFDINSSFYSLLETISGDSFFRK